MKLKVYQYSKCGTCVRALRWLEEHKIPYTSIPIRDQPPTVMELRRVLVCYDGQIRKLFNTSGLDYKAMRMKDRLPGLTEADAIKLLAENGNLVRRPFIVCDKGGLVGFDEEQWGKLLE